MAIFYLDWGGDYLLTPNGSIQQASGWDESRQLTVRTLFTNPSATLPSGKTIPPDYIFAPNFGAGLGLYVGQNMTRAQKNQLTVSIQSQVLSQQAVDPSVIPKVSFQNITDKIMIIFVSFKLKSGEEGTVVLQTG